MTVRTINHKSPFNTPIESGLRTLFIISELAPNNCDLQRLVYYDYLLVHSSDVADGPESIHPATPYRAGELLIRRRTISDGLDLMFARELIKKNFSEKGITYQASELTKPFLAFFTSKYSMHLKRNAEWVIEFFSCYSDQELHSFMTSNLGRWGAEFKRESLIREVPL